MPKTEYLCRLSMTKYEKLAVKLTNLKQMAETIVYVQEHGYDTRDDLQNQYKEILFKGQRAKSALNAISAELK